MCPFFYVGCHTTVARDAPRALYEWRATMTTAGVGLTTVLALFTIGSSVLAGGCGRPSQRAFGNVDLIVDVPADVELTPLEFEISEGDAPVAAGRIAAPRAARELSQLVTRVPVSDDARVDVTGMSSDGLEGCTGSAPFAVARNATTRVRVTLVCQGVDDGMVHITIGIVCPGAHLVSLTVSPLSASVGETIDVAAVDRDPDAGVLRYAWSATAGTFEAPSSATTTYRCTSPGAVTMSLVVSSDLCEESHTIGGVTCFVASSGGADAGADAD